MMNTYELSEARTDTGRSRSRGKREVGLPVTSLAYRGTYSEECLDFESFQATVHGSTAFDVERLEPS